MSIRVSTTPLITGAVIVGVPGLGVLGSTVPSTGDAGAGYAYAYLTSAEDNKEIRGVITSWPSAGTLTAYEDTSFVFEAPDGEYTFNWRLYIDGVAGDEYTETLVIGSEATEVEGPAVITAASTIAASGSKQSTSPAIITASASVGMGGVKGAVAPLNIVGSISIGTAGIKSTSSPATITSAAEYGASGIKTLIGLDKEGPAVISASSTVGMGGVKGGVGTATILSNLNYSLTGTKNVVAPCHLTVESIISVDGIKQAIIGCNITAEFILFARKGLDFYPTPRISIESSVTRKIILGSTVTKSIAKAVSIGVNVNIK